MEGQRPNPYDNLEPQATPSQPSIKAEKTACVKKNPVSLDQDPHPQSRRLKCLHLTVGECSASCGAHVHFALLGLLSRHAATGLWVFHSLVSASWLMRLS